MKIPLGNKITYHIRSSDAPLNKEDLVAMKVQQELDDLDVLAGLKCADDKGEESNTLERATRVAPRQRRRHRVNYSTMMDDQ